MDDRDSTVPVALGPRSYDIRIRAGILAEIGAEIRRTISLTHAVIITDENVETPHAVAAAESLAREEITTDLVIVPPGESSKSEGMAAELWQRLLEVRADRKTVVVAVGGGVVGDLAGFAAATFARGLRFVQVPTTLLAQVDSSVGGKVGVNLPEAKNIVGAFWQPVGVWIDSEVLSTLPQREYRAGLAEVVKYGMILDADFFACLEQHADEINVQDPAVLQHIISRSCELKAGIVIQDEREETGLRSVLNYGHTFAHAFEATLGYDALLHGEAVAIGMLCASRLAERLGRIDKEVTRRQEQLLAALGLSVEVPDANPNSLLSAMRHDKKVEHGRLRFVLPTRIGHVELVDDVPEADVMAALSG